MCLRLTVRKPANLFRYSTQGTKKLEPCRTAASQRFKPLCAVTQSEIV
jgi:hypothetical protein